MFCASDVTLTVKELQTPFDEQTLRVRVPLLAPLMVSELPLKEYATPLPLSVEMVYGAFPPESCIVPDCPIPRVRLDGLSENPFPALLFVEIVVELQILSLPEQTLITVDPLLAPEKDTVLPYSVAGTALLFELDAM